MDDDVKLSLRLREYRRYNYALPFWLWRHCFKIACVGLVLDFLLLFSGVIDELTVSLLAFAWLALSALLGAINDRVYDLRAVDTVMKIFSDRIEFTLEKYENSKNEFYKEHFTLPLADVRRILIEKSYLAIAGRVHMDRFAYDQNGLLVQTPIVSEDHAQLLLVLNLCDDEAYLNKAKINEALPEDGVKAYSMKGLLSKAGAELVG